MVYPLLPSEAKSLGTRLMSGILRRVGGGEGWGWC